MLEQITQILRDYKSEPDLQVSADSTFESLGFDSLDLMQLVMDAEEAFGVTIDVSEPVTTVDGLMAIIEKAKG